MTKLLALVLLCWLPAFVHASSLRGRSVKANDRALSSSTYVYTAHVGALMLAPNDDEDDLMCNKVLSVPDVLVEGLKFHTIEYLNKHNSQVKIGQSSFGEVRVERHHQQDDDEWTITFHGCCGWECHHDSTCRHTTHEGIKNSRLKHFERHLSDTLTSDFRKICGKKLLASASNNVTITYESSSGLQVSG